MNSKGLNIEKSTVSVGVGERQLQIDFGEVFFPLITLIFCVAYYVDTRGLPERSMLYAEWLLYITALLAVITLFVHGVSIRSADPEPVREDGGNPATDLDELPKEEETTISSESDTQTAETELEDEATGDEGSNPHFTVRTSAGLAVLTAAYIGLLNVFPFVAVSPLFLAAGLYMFGERNIIRLVLYSVGFTAVTWAVFIKWLVVPLP
jgi:hypothetical protein